jgi:plastocyanin
MRVTILLSGIALAVCADAGTIAGTVRAQGRTDGASEGGGGSYESRKYKFLQKIDYEAMRDFVVYIDGPAATNAHAPERPVQVITTRKITQRGAVFTPHILPIMAGTTVEWPNYDDIYHNVFSMSEAKPFDLGLYKTVGEKGETKNITFDQSGRVDVFCSIHASMNCIVLVLPNPWFASADAAGHYTITNVPAGNYTLKAWHERLPSQARQITVPADGTVTNDFTLGIVNLPKY